MLIEFLIFIHLTLIKLTWIKLTSFQLILKIQIKLFFYWILIRFLIKFTFTKFLSKSN